METGKSSKVSHRKLAQPTEQKYGKTFTCKKIRELEVNVASVTQCEFFSNTLNSDTQNPSPDPNLYEKLG
jgi:hypothetical protein